MVSDIKGPTGMRLPHLESKVRAPDGASDIKANQQTRAQAENVVLTETASKLRRLQAALKDIPIVDPKRVEEARQAIADGNYRVDPQRVAEKFVQLERLLNDSTR